jgi:hypothetical protein
MKYSQLIGIAAVLVLVAVCFIPWTYIAAVNITVMGFHADGTNYGKPGLALVFLGAVCTILFLTPKIWAKRTNVFIAAILFAWSIKNFIIVGACFAGECPEKKAGLYLQLLFSFIVLLMSFFPKIALPEEKA